MRHLLLFAASLLAATAVGTVPGSAMAETLEDYKWQNRLLVIFTPSVIDDRYDRQMQILLRNRVETRNRDLLPVEVIGVEPVRVDALTEPDMQATVLRQRFEVPGNGFHVVLIGKDGTAKLSSDQPIPADELFDTIDAMPMRRREMQQQD